MTREQRRRIQKMSSGELTAFLAAIWQDGYDNGYAEGLTADLDDDEFVVVDESVARQRISDDAFIKLLGGE